MDGTASSGDVDSKRVEAALLAGDSQYMRQSRRNRTGNSPGSSWPPIRHPNCPNGLARCQRRCRRLKVKAKNISQAQNGQTTYRMHASTAQLRRNPLRHCWEVHGPKRQHDRTKIEPTKVKIECLNDKMPQEDERTYHGCARAAQPCVNAPRHRYGVHRPRRQCGHIKTVPENVNPAQEVEKTYWVRASVAQPCGNALKHCWEVHRPKRRCGRIKIASRNVNRTRNGRRTYLGRVNAIQSTWRPKKGIKRFNKLTFGFRMLGEYWRKVEDYG